MPRYLFLRDWHETDKSWPSPRLWQSHGLRRVVGFVDAARVVHGNFLGCLWC
jgi:hypothetical protein